MTKPLKIKDPFENQIKEPDTDNIIPDSGSDEVPVIINPDIATLINQGIAKWLNNLPSDDLFPNIKSSFSSAGNRPPTSTIPDYPVVPIETLPQLGGKLTPLWKTIGQLPGYAQSGIRKMGRDIFMSFPCFRIFAESCQKEGTDPLAKVFVASDLTHNQTAVNWLARMISEKGKEVQAGQMDHTGMIEGYKPRIIMFMTEKYTFKLVEDRPEYGAPISLNSIYAWPGGIQHYRDNKKAITFNSPNSSPSVR